MLPRSFKDVLAKTGSPPFDVWQDAARHYSETISKEIALWLGGVLQRDSLIERVLPPEAKIPTCYGKKSLDVGCLDASGYLALDISIKTFNFRDRKTKRYTHNYTGRFYELLGEGLDLRRSYPESVLAALVFIPSDGCDDGTRLAASSFGHLTKQFSKIAGRGGVGEHALSFEHVFVGLWDVEGSLAFFDAALPPPKSGRPKPGQLLAIEEVLRRLLATVKERTELRTPHSMSITPAFRWAD